MMDELSQMSATSKVVSPIEWDTESKKLSVLDQRFLPKETKYVDIPNSLIGFEAIKSMMVRGAPLIAAVGCLSIIAEINQANFLASNALNKPSDVVNYVVSKLRYVVLSRPTAVNLSNAAKKLETYAHHILPEAVSPDEVITRLTRVCEDALTNGNKFNISLGDLGAQAIQDKYPSKDKLFVLTHCNTGSLATVGYGTALGVIRSLKKRNLLGGVYCTETRPYNQGSRLTAWELVTENIPATLIADNMVAYLMTTKQVDAVIVGADRVALNGDTANKIGTLQIAITAHHYGVPFYVAAPLNTIDKCTKDLSQVTIEERPGNELKSIVGVDIAPDEIEVWNPCFDVTPADLITGIITESFAIVPKYLENRLASLSSNQFPDTSYTLLY